jgi:hypothetical protein
MRIEHLRTPLDTLISLVVLVSQVEHWSIAGEPSRGGATPARFQNRPTACETMQIRAVGMRNYTLVVLVWSMKTIVVGVGLQFADSGGLLGTESLKFASLPAPLDYCFRSDDIMVEALLLGPSTDAGVVSINGDGKGSGELLGRFVRDGEMQIDIGRAGMY